MEYLEFYMTRCIQLAKNGLGTTYPNPLVGCVIVYDDKIIGEGWHYKSGLPHAEVMAINSVSDKELLKKATIYVSLEPCSHFGKTPPCSTLIIDSGIKKVVIGSTDPNPEVAGRGIKKLEDAGIEVVKHVLEKECNELNKRFFTYHSKKRPYIILKWAQSNDGFIAPGVEDRNETKPVWISNEYSRQLAHKLRGEEMAILVGTNTVKQDNPSLTTREWSGKNPTRFVLDRSGRLSHTSRVFDDNSKTYIFTSAENVKEQQNNVEYLPIDFSYALAQQICDQLYKLQVQSVIIEGGTRTLKTFIDEKLWDEAYVFIGKSMFNQGIAAPILHDSFFSTQKIVDDLLLHYINKNVLR